MILLIVNKYRSFHQDELDEKRYLYTNLYSEYSVVYARDECSTICKLYESCID